MDVDNRFLAVARWEMWPIALKSIAGRDGPKGGFVTGWLSCSSLTGRHSNLCTPVHCGEPL